jgi:hypothetical protein
MAEPGVPDGDESDLRLPCGETIDPTRDVDMGMREFRCACGETHAVVLDVHPPSRFLPEDIVSVLREATEAADSDRVGEFGTHHLLGMVREDDPEMVASADVSETGAAGYTMVWVTDVDARTLHEIIVELVVEMMEHAVSHGTDESAAAEFESHMREFDVAAFVDAYRSSRDFDDEHDSVF